MSLFDRIQGRHQAYKHIFKGPYADKVLADLRRFCRADSPTFDPENDRVSALLEGRREVWLRIQSFIHLTDGQIKNLREDYTDE